MSYSRCIRCATFIFIITSSCLQRNDLRESAEPIRCNSINLSLQVSSTLERYVAENLVGQDSLGVVMLIANDANSYYITSRINRSTINYLRPLQITKLVSGRPLLIFTGLEHYSADNADLSQVLDNSLYVFDDYDKLPISYHPVPWKVIFSSDSLIVEEVVTKNEYKLIDSILFDDD